MAGRASGCGLAMSQRWRSSAPRSGILRSRTAIRPWGCVSSANRGANVLSTLDQVKAAAVGLEPELEAKGLTIRPSFDPSVFIKRAINLLAGNLMIGILLAIGVLWLFLRQVRATLLIALTIPICLLTTFAVLETTGRTLNVISLAGLAFAVGMVPRRRDCRAREHRATAREGDGVPSRGRPRRGAGLGGPCLPQPRQPSRFSSPSSS